MKTITQSVVCTILLTIAGMAQLPAQEDKIAEAKAVNTSSKPEEDKGSRLAFTMVLQPATLKDLVEMERFLAALEISELEEEVKEISKIFMPDHPKVKAAKAALEKAELRLQRISKAADRARAN